MLHLLVPGLGHILWREYLFGLFIFLVGLIAAILYLASYFIHLSIWAALMLLGLPIVFYGFTFLDLSRSIARKRKQFIPSGRMTTILIGFGVVYQLASPIAPVNLAVVNAPEVFTLESSALSPRYNKGDLLKASSLDYVLNIYLLGGPLWHAVPERYDMVRFTTPGGKAGCGIVIGRPGEQIEVWDGTLVINGVSGLLPPPPDILLQGDWPLTYSDDFSIIVAIPRLGVISDVQVVPLGEVHGKVSSIL